MALRRAGSSPHTRGARDVDWKFHFSIRIIPAYAGSTAASRPLAGRVADHPRIRGEHSRPLSPPWATPGSSPHTRGAHQDPRRQPRPGRIIPAYAGSTAAHLRPDRLLPDHPRIRGEHKARGVWPVGADGSSPHTRGAQRLTYAPTGSYRIIPAYAGSTKPAGSGPWARTDHPRIRGEHSSSGRFPCCLAGSSPHTRGALRQGFRGLERSGIIPAYAGSTPCTTVRSPRPWDHPRIRGEHQHDVETSSSHTGSSPHTRGARGLHDFLGDFGGIIPAYAGSTSGTRKSQSIASDHPRIRGEHSRLLTPRPVGSRIIPAYAGSTHR